MNKRIVIEAIVIGAHMCHLPIGHPDRVPAIRDDDIPNLKRYFSNLKCNVTILDNPTPSITELTIGTLMRLYPSDGFSEVFFFVVYSGHSNLDGSWYLREDINGSKKITPQMWVEWWERYKPRGLQNPLLKMIFFINSCFAQNFLLSLYLHPDFKIFGSGRREAKEDFDGGFFIKLLICALGLGDHELTLNSLILAQATAEEANGIWVQNQESMLQNLNCNHPVMKRLSLLESTCVYSIADGTYHLYGEVDLVPSPYAYKACSTVHVSRYQHSNSPTTVYVDPFYINGRNVTFHVTGGSLIIGRGGGSGGTSTLDPPMRDVKEAVDLVNGNFHDLNRINQAIIKLRNVMQLYPCCAIAKVLLLQIYLELAKVNENNRLEAITYLNSGLDIFPHSSVFLATKVNHLTQLLKFNEAETCSLKCLELQAHDSDNHLRMGKIYYYKKDFINAKKYLLVSRCLRGDPHFIPCWVGVTYFCLGEYDNAILELDKVTIQNVQIAPYMDIVLYKVISLINLNKSIIALNFLKSSPALVLPYYLSIQLHFSNHGHLPGVKWISDRIKFKETKTIEGHTKEIISITYNRMERLIKSSSLDGTIKFWSLKGILESTISNPNYRCYQLFLRSPSNNLISIGTVLEARDPLHMWFTATIKKIQRPKIFIHYEGMEESCDEWIDVISEAERLRPVNNLQVGQNFADEDERRIRRAEKITNFPLSFVQNDFAGSGEILGYNIEDKSGGHDKIILWDRKTNKKQELVSASFKYPDFFTPRLNTTRNEIIYGHNNFVEICDLESKIVTQFPTEHQDIVYPIALHEGKQWIASGSHDSLIKLWDRNTHNCIMTLDGHGGPIMRLCFLTDTELLSCSEDKTIKLWNIQSGKCTRTFCGHTATVWIIHFHYQTLLSGSGDKTIRLWDLKSGLCLQVLQGHEDRVRGAFFEDDGNTIISCSGKTIRIWKREI